MSNLLSSSLVLLLNTLAITTLCAADNPTGALPAAKQDSEETAVPLEVYTGPVVKKTDMGEIYPHAEAAAGRENWTTLSMMVGTNGKPYEIVAVDSMGNTVLDNAAINGVKKWQFEPAKLNGAPVDSVFSFTMTFRVSTARRVPEAFISRYNALNAAVDGNDRAAADAVLGALKVDNLYEYAYYNFALYRYFSRWGDQHQQLTALERATGQETEMKLLPEKLAQSALRTEFLLQAAMSDFGGALKTYQRLSAADQQDPELMNAVAKINALASCEQSYAIADEIPATTSWFITLLKRNFTIDVLDGQIDEIKLRCNKKYLFIRYEAGLRYTTSDKYGVCNIQLLGHSGTKFILTQS